MSAANEVKSITGDVRHAAEQGRKFTDARNALIAYAVLVVELTQSALALETGVDKGDVSRVVKAAKGSPEALAALKSLVRAGKSQPQRITDAALIGETYLRRERKAAAKGESAESAESTGSTVKAPAPSESTSDTIQAYAEGVYGAALGMTKKDRERFLVAITDAFRAAEVDAKRIASGNTAHGLATAEVAA